MSHQTFTLNADSTRATAAEDAVQADGTTVAHLAYTWTYDADGRLTKESLTASDPSLNYADEYTFDLNGNRVSDARTRTAAGAPHGPDDTTVYAYNGDDQLLAAGPDANGDGVPDPATATAYAYDANGSQRTATAGGATTTFTFDVRNKMVGVSGNGHTAAYVYDDAGDRAAETDNGTTTYYLTDAANPTGYAQPVEQRSAPAGTPTLTYLIGDHVYGQIAATGTPTYYLTDGHGSTVALRSATGTVALAYTAYGDPLNFSAVTVGTAHLFGGDAMYDPASGLYLHGDGTRGRDGFRFVEADSEGNGSSNDPISLNNNLYAGASPTTIVDPSGHMSTGEAAVAAGCASLLIAMGLHSIYANAVHSSMAYSQGNYREGTLALEQELIGMLSFGFRGPPGGMTPALQAVDATISVSAASTQTAAALAFQYLALFSAPITSFGGHSYVQRPNDNPQSAGSNGETRIVGQSSSGSQTDGHAEAIDEIARQEAAKPGRLVIFLQRSLRTVTARAYGTRQIPDVVVVRYKVPGDITKGLQIDLWEVRSNSQTRPELQAKIDAEMNLLPKDMQGDTNVINP